MDINFIDTYMPAAAEISQDTLYSTRERLSSYFELATPGVETNPNTVVGDLIVTPQTYMLAAIEEGLNKFANDLDLGNVANGKINNCAFVAEWLKNFSIDSTDKLRASGVVRVTFNSPSAVVLDRSTKFNFNEILFSIHLPNIGPFTIYSPGTPRPTGENCTIMIDAGDGTYFADIPVLGELDLNAVEEEEVQEEETIDVEDADAEPEVEEEIEPVVTKGTEAIVTPAIPGSVTVYALNDFDSGSEVISIKDLAKRARTTLHSASLNTRNGAINYVSMLCPFIDCIYATHNGDREMLREFHNPFGMAMGCLDVYVRTKSYNFTEEQTLTLYLNEDETAYEGEWHYVGQPYHVESVTNENVDQPNIDHIITSKNDRNLGAIAAYSIHEKLFLSIPEATDEHGDSIYNPVMDESGKFYATFTIKYQTDPMFAAVASSVECEDNRPVNTSILVRGFIPIIIYKFEVVYVRTPGVVPDLDLARKKIKEYMGNVGSPYVYTDAVIAMIMKECGAKYMKHINLQAKIQWTVGHNVMNYKGEIEPVPNSMIFNTDDLRVNYPGENADIEGTSMYACSVRNLRYWFMEGALTFNEIRDI